MENSIDEKNINRIKIHWFPGHMMRTLRSIEKMLPTVDAIVQLLDARIPASSLNPELHRYYKNKPRIYILNKADLASPEVTKEWAQFLKKENSIALPFNSKKGGSTTNIRKAISSSLAELLQRREEKGTSGAKTRLMITGIPNVGKSTFINNWVGAAKTKAADRPGVTRGAQWVSAGEYELLDMPGVLWKKFETQEIAVNLALIGSIPDNLLNVEDMAAVLLAQIAQIDFITLKDRYKLIDTQSGEDGWQLLEAVGRKRGMLISGGEIDTERAAITVLDEFRAGKLGKLSLEKPQDNIMK